MTYDIILFEGHVSNRSNEIDVWIKIIMYFQMRHITRAYNWHKWIIFFFFLFSLSHFLFNLFLLLLFFLFIFYIYKLCGSTSNSECVANCHYHRYLFHIRRTFHSCMCMCVCLLPFFKKWCSASFANVPI